MPQHRRAAAGHHEDGVVPGAEAPLLRPRPRPRTSLSTGRSVAPLLALLLPCLPVTGHVCGLENIARARAWSLAHVFVLTPPRLVVLAFQTLRRGRVPRPGDVSREPCGEDRVEAGVDDARAGAQLEGVGGAGQEDAAGVAPAAEVVLEPRSLLAGGDLFVARDVIFFIIPHYRHLWLRGPGRRTRR